MESKIKDAQEWVNEMEDAMKIKLHHTLKHHLLHLVSLSQRQAIEATLEIVSKKAKIGSLKYINDNWEEVQLLSNIQCSSGCFSVSKASILELNDSPELKVI